MTDAASVRERAVDAGYAVAWAAASRVPFGASRAAALRAADRTWARGGPQIRMLEANLRRVLGADAAPDEVTSTSREAMRSYLRYWAEAFALPGWSREQLLDRLDVLGQDALDASLGSGRGTVLALPHSGNWDLVGAWLAMTRGPFDTVAERLRPEGLFDRFVRFREGLGMTVLPADGGPRVLARLGRTLREGGVVCLMADRDLALTGVPVTFFGEAAHLPAGPAALAAATGADLRTVRLHYEPDRLIVTVEGLVAVDPALPRAAAVETTTRAIAERFETAIAEHPADWHMLQPFWDADRRPTEAVPA